MFFENGKSGLTESGRYLLGMLLIIVFYLIGQLPLFAVINWSIQSNPSITVEAYDQFEQTTDFTVFGISSNLGFILMITIFAFATLGLYLALKFIHHKQFLSIITPGRKIDWKRIGFSWSLWFLLGCMVEVFFYLYAPDNYSFDVDWGQWLVLLLIALFYLPVQSSLEEFVFRGYLLQGIGINTNSRLIALISTSVLFALPHSFNPEIEQFGLLPMFTYYILAGFILGIIVIMDDRLELALGVHAATNFIGASIIGYEGSILQTDTLFTQKEVSPFLMILIFGLTGTLFLLACKRLYKWPSFNKLLAPIESDRIKS